MGRRHRPAANAPSGNHKRIFNYHREDKASTGNIFEGRFRTGPSFAGGSLPLRAVFALGLSTYFNNVPLFWKLQFYARTFFGCLKLNFWKNRRFHLFSVKHLLKFCVLSKYVFHWILKKYFNNIKKTLKIKRTNKILLIRQFLINCNSMYFLYRYNLIFHLKVS